MAGEAEVASVLTSIASCTMAPRSKAVMFRWAVLNIRLAITATSPAPSVTFCVAALTIAIWAAKSAWLAEMASCAAS